MGASFHIQNYLLLRLIYYIKAMVPSYASHCYLASVKANQQKQSALTHVTKMHWLLAIDLVPDEVSMLLSVDIIV